MSEPEISDPVDTHRKLRLNILNTLLGLFIIVDVTTLVRYLFPKGGLAVAFSSGVPYTLRIATLVAQLVALYAIWKWKKWGIYLFAGIATVGWTLTFLTGKITTLTIVALVWALLMYYLTYRYILKPLWKNFS